jgi:hypothetical protein
VSLLGLGLHDEKLVETRLEFFRQLTSMSAVMKEMNQ